MGGSQTLVTRKAQGSPRSRIRVQWLPPHYAPIKGCSEAVYEDGKVTAEREVLGRGYAMPLTHPASSIGEIANILGGYFAGGESREDGQCLVPSLQCFACRKEKKGRLN